MAAVPVLTPVISAEPLTDPWTVRTALLSDDQSKSTLRTVSPVDCRIATANTESRAPWPRTPRAARESDSRTTTRMSLLLSVGTEQDASATAHAAPNPRARTG